MPVSSGGRLRPQIPGVGANVGYFFDQTAADKPANCTHISVQSFLVFV